MAKAVSLGALARSRYWRDADARAAVAAWQASGRPVRGFAEAHDLGVGRLSRWVARLSAGRGKRGRLEGGARAAVRPASKVRFHPVELVGLRASAPRSSSTEAFELMLLDGRRVRVPAGFASEDLTRLLGVLEGARQC